MITPRSIYDPIFLDLRSNNFHFSENWVIDCVNYLKSTKPGISLEALKNDVKQQWLSLNLRDIKVPSLPPDLKSKKEVTINGKFAVQVESMIDSSRSCYSQFQKLLSADTDHIDIREEDEKSKRCLTFHISDGVQELHAMEYEVIKKIKTNDPKLRPGFKMVIIGPVECRKGMLLLKDENVRLCGGEVEAFVITNSLKNVLIRRLELDPDDYPEITDAPLEENEIPQIHPNETVSRGNIDDDFESLLSQDDDVFFNVPLQPMNHERQPVDRVEDLSDDIWNDEVNHKSSASTHCQESLLTSGMISQDSDVDNSASSAFPNQNLIEIDNDVIFEDYVELQSKVQTSTSKSRNPMQTKLPSFFKNGESSLNSAYRTSVESKKPNFVFDKPFVYLKHIKQVKLAKPTVFILKAIILTLKKKLTIEKDEYKLKAIITDGSSSVEVDFCSEILETFLGYSPCEMTTMIKAKQTNSAVAQRVKESFSKAQEKLISLNCLMEVKFFVDGKSPLILSVSEVTMQTLIALKERQLLYM